MTKTLNIKALAAVLTATVILITPFSVNAAVPPGLLNGDTPTLAPMLEKALPAVVNIVATGEVEVQQNPFFNDPFFRHFFDMPNQPRKRENQSVGSGVIIDSKNGYVLTNHHVINNADTITVRLSDDREIEAELVGADPETDIALIKIEAKNITALTLSDSDSLRVGDFVVAIGNPFGLRQTVTSGIVSGLGRHGLGKRYEDFIQTDASINPGNSGGALVNLQGELVGINTAILSRGGGNIGIGFAIPTNLIKAVMEQIVKFGEVKRGRLGIIGQDLTSDLAKAFNLKRNRGVVVAQVVPDSAADKAGIEPGDVVIKIDDQEVKDFAQLRNNIGLLRIGQKARIEILRDGKPRIVSATIQAAPEEKLDSGGLHSGLAGAGFVEIDGTHPLAGRVEGVVVSRVDANSPAMAAGLQVGDVVTSVNRKPVKNLEAFRELAKIKGRLLLHIRRGNGALFILIR